MSSAPRVLALSRNFPNPEFPTLGLWARRLVDAARPVSDIRVIAPVPWIPPLVPGRLAPRFRAVPGVEAPDGLPVLHPRVPVTPGSRLHAWESRIQYPRIRHAADRLREEWRFDLIHAHFIYPDGVMAARLGQRYGIPVITTEHALWEPWLDDWPGVRRQVMESLDGISMITSVSTAVHRSVLSKIGSETPTAILPNVVDEAVFSPPEAGATRDPDLLLFVGAVRHVKGLDVLVRALGLLVPDRPKLRLLVIGEAFYGQWKRDEDAVKELCRELGLEDQVVFAGRAEPPEVADAMRRAALLVVPARRESFSAVAAEALACGTPVVSTRCGGPEDFISDEVGALVDREDPGALARAIDATLERRSRLDPAVLRSTAVERFGRESATRRLGELYHRVLAGSAGR